MKIDIDKQAFVELARNSPPEAVEKVYDMLQGLADLVADLSPAPSTDNAANDQPLELTPIEKAAQ